MDGIPCWKGVCRTLNNISHLHDKAAASGGAEIDLLGAILNDSLLELVLTIEMGVGLLSLMS